MAAKTFETQFRIGAKYTGGPEVAKATRDIGRVERSVRNLGTHLNRARKHFFDFGKVAAGAFAGFTAASIIGAAIRNMKSLTTAAFNAADEVTRLREENERLLMSFGLSSQEAKETEKRLYAVAQAMQAVKGGGHDAELMSKALVGLRKSLDEKVIIAHKEAISGYVTLLADGAIPTIEHAQQAYADINNAILLGKSPIFKSLGWTKTHIKIFKEKSRADKERILLMEMERKGWHKLTEAFYKTDTGKMTYAMTVWGDLLEEMGDESAKQKGKIGEMLITLAERLRPITKELGKWMGNKLAQWLTDINKNMPDIIKNFQIWWKRLSTLWEIGQTFGKIWWKLFLGPGLDLLGRVLDLIVAVWETIKGDWGAIPRWFNENVIKEIAILWDWLIGNSYMVDGARAGWEKIKDIWRLWADWFWVHVVDPISKMWGGLWTAGGAFRGGGGRFGGRGATGGWGDTGRAVGGSGAGSGVTDAGGGEPGSTGPNAAIEAERAAVMEELKDPATRRLVAATIAQEQGSAAGRADVLESLVNRAVRQKKSLRSLITGGFYGPYNRGTVNNALRRGMSPAAMEEFDKIAEEVRRGRNAVKGRVDQGMINEVKRGGRIRVRGEYYGFWGKSDTNTEAYRQSLRGVPTEKASDQQQQAIKMRKQAPKTLTPSPEQNYVPLQPYPGQPGLQGTTSSLRDMIRPMNMRGRTSGQVPQNIALSPVINVHGVPADRAGAVGDEVVRAMQDPSRRLIAQMKKSRADEQRLNMDA